jgi:glycosyltransferase 2 family protein
MRVNRPKSGFFYLRLAFGALLLVFLFRLVDFDRLATTLSSVKLHFIFASFLAMLLNYGVKTYRWALILRIPRPDLSFGDVARFNFVSIFLGNFLPTNLSSDFVRIYYISRQTADPGAAISSIFADRIIGNFAVAITTVAAFLTLRQTGIFDIGSLLSYSIVLFLLLSIAVPLMLQHPAVINLIRKLLNRFIGQKLFTMLQEMSRHLVLYRNQMALVAQVLGLAFLNVIIVVFEFYFIAQGFSAQISIEYFFLFIPLLVYLSMLPVSVGGIGLLEAGLVLFFSRIGMPLETCLSTALSFRILQLGCALPGAMIYLFGDFSSRELSARC